MQVMLQHPMVHIAFAFINNTMWLMKLLWFGGAVSSLLNLIAGPNKSASTFLEYQQLSTTQKMPRRVMITKVVPCFLHEDGTGEAAHEKSTKYHRTTLSR
jgi:hypothetical protein